MRVTGVAPKRGDRARSAAGLCVLVLALALGSAASAGGGNSGVAHLCQQGGWQILTTTGGTFFRHQGDCVSYGARGGTLLEGTGCFIVDADDPANYSTSSLGDVAAAAAVGDTLIVEGVCVGSTTLDESLTIDGRAAAGYAAPTLLGSAGPQPSGVVTVAAGADVTINALTISGGTTSAEGAGIDNQGTLTVNDSVVTDNVGVPSASGPGLGSGIWNDGTLVLSGTTVSDNTDDQVGGGIMNESGNLTLDDSTVEDNTSGNGATSGNGGGIENGGSVTLNGSSAIDDNHAAFGGGVDSNFAHTATLTLNDASSISGNSAHIGGGVDNFVFGAGASATVTLNDMSSIIGNTADTSLGGYGGGIFNGANLGATATVILNGSSIVSGNSAVPAGPGTGYGGGIANNPENATGTAAVSCARSATVTHNSAVAGGGIYNYPGGILTGCLASVNVVDNSPDDIG